VVRLAGSSVAVPSRVHPGGAASPQSRDVILQFGTNLDNFGLIHLRWLTRDRPRIRVKLQLWDAGGQRVARSQVGSGDCTIELDLE
jgi:hypothetical protein